VNEVYRDFNHRQFKVRRETRETLVSLARQGDQETREKMVCQDYQVRKVNQDLSEQVVSLACLVDLDRREPGARTVILA